jgi:hypothetical protein
MTVVKLADVVVEIGTSEPVLTVGAITVGAGDAGFWLACAA